MKSFIAIAVAWMAVGCASTNPRYIQREATNAGPVAVITVLVVAGDEILGCPMNAAGYLGESRPEDACESKGIPRYEAKIQGSNN
jgi:hypothetical protein